MRFTALRFIFNSTVAAAFVVGPVLYISGMYHSGGPVWSVVATGLLIQVLDGAEALARQKDTNHLLRVLRTVRGVFVGVGAGIVFVNIVVVPHSAYITWFALAARGNARGVVSFVFVVTAGFFGAVLGGLVHRQGVLRSLPALFVECSLIAAIVTGSTLAVLLCVASGLTGILTVSWTNLSLRHRLQIAGGVSVFLTVVIGAGGVAQALVKSGGNATVDAVVSPALREALLSVLPQFPILYAIPGYGSSFDSLPLGSSPVLSDTAMFRVSAPQGDTIYLRTAVYDTYEKSDWSISPEAYRAAKKDAEKRFQSLYDRALRRRGSEDIAVTVLGDFYSYLPNVLGLRDFGFVPSRDRETSRLSTEDPLRSIEYGSPDTGFLMSFPFVHGDEIILRTGAPQPTGKQVPEADLLEVPDSVPADVRDAARSFGAPLHVTLESDARGESTLRAEVLARARSIRAYIQSRTTYTLDTRRPPPGTDLVAYFLFDHRSGYCVHFATSFAILARLSGIPTRYVTGFLVNMPDNSDTRVVTGYTAHAWPEIWVPGQGWTTFEVTPPLEASRYADPAYYYRFDTSRFTSRQLRALVGDRVALRTQTQLDGTKSGSGWLHSLVLLLLVLGAGTAVVLIALRYVRPALGGAELQLKSACRRVTRIAGELGVPSPAATGWRGWQVSARARVTLRRRRKSAEPERRDGIIFGRMVTLAHQVFFGGRQVTRRDARFARTVSACMPTTLSVRISRVRRHRRTDGDLTESD